MWEAAQLSRTVSLFEVLLVLLAGIGIPMHLWGWHDAVLDEGAILAGARNTTAGAVLLRLARGHARSEAIRLGVKVIVLIYALGSMQFASGPFGPWAQVTLLIIVVLLSLETWFQRWDRRRMMLGNARTGPLAEVCDLPGLPDE